MSRKEDPLRVVLPRVFPRCKVYEEMIHALDRTGVLVTRPRRPS